VWRASKRRTAHLAGEAKRICVQALSQVPGFPRFLSGLPNTGSSDSGFAAGRQLRELRSCAIMAESFDCLPLLLSQTVGSSKEFALL